MTVASSDTTEGTLSVSSLTFTPMKERAADSGRDRRRRRAHRWFRSLHDHARRSTAPNYMGIDPSDVSVSNTDNDVASLYVSNTAVIEGTGTDPQVTFNATVDVPVPSGFTVPYTTADGSATRTF